MSEARGAFLPYLKLSVTRNVNLFKQGPLFNIRVVDGVCRFIDSTEGDDGPLYLNPSLDHPLYAEAVDTALSLCDPEHGTPLHVKIVLEWDRDSKEK